MTDALLLESMEITRVHHETRDTFTFDLDARPRGGFRFAPGQFNMLYAFGLGEVPISISGDPLKPAVLTHTIRAVGPTTRGLEALKKGDGVGVRGPFGTPWPVDEAQGKDVIVVAGGIGLAPLRPAIYSMLSRRQAFGKLCIAYGARTPADILYEKEIERWRGRIDVDLEVTVDRGDPDWRGHTGVVTKLLRRFELTPESTVALLCGPEVMMRFASRELEGLGVPSARIYVSMERNMKCGVGSCGHCQLGPSFVCKDGPVYPLTKAEPLMGIREL
ncbi:MAG: FAD/NAD(P)-binding protein [Polyangiaceae bacterium]|nr:FAD/NAD(P)-binding protein [Polyangiaceae bacterium]